jgi:hypothetical protein
MNVMYHSITRFQIPRDTTNKLDVMLIWSTLE